jgi:hypothetical protein
MNLRNFILAFAVVFLPTFAASIVGYKYGELYRQNTIVEECRTNGMYIDRNLFMVCQVSTPKVVPKPPTL